MDSAWAILSYVSLVVGFLLAVIAVAHMLRQKRSPQSMIAWLLAIILIPHVGVPLYLVLGGRKMRRMAARKQKIRLPRFGVDAETGANPIVRLLSGYELPDPTCAKFELCETGEEMFERLMELIRSAQRSIHITMFILSPDEVGRAVVAALTRRARDGVSVRVLLDDLGTMHTPRSLFKSLTAAGGKVAKFMPVWHKPLKFRLDLRNHRKLVVADGARVLSGGANIANEYMGPTPSAERWRDLAFVLEGPVAALYDELFRRDWEFASGETLPIAPVQPANFSRDESAIVQVVPSGPDIEGDPVYGAIVSAIHSAQDRLWIVTPYFVPDDALEQSLILAAYRGVDVRVIMPRKSNHPVTDLVRGTYLREIQSAGGHVHLYVDGMVHAKAMLVDTTAAMLGSVNMDVRSLFLNYEVALFLYGSREIADIEMWMQTLTARSREGVEPVGAFRDICEGVARIGAPLL